MGLGLHGGALGTIEWLYGQGAKLVVTDLKKSEELTSTLMKLEKYPNIEYVLGEHRERDFTETDLVIRNPAVPRSSLFLELAKQKGIPIDMDSSLFFDYCPSQKIIGVTGSKGKTTTTNAIAILLKAAFPNTVAVGVDGISPLGELSVIQSDSPVVFELSSWRLEALEPKHVSPPVAVVTSLYRDHLNTYASFENYIETKKIIIRYQKADDLALLNSDDSLIAAWEPEIKSRLFWYTVEALGDRAGIGVNSGWVVVRLEGGDEAQQIIQWDELPLSSVHERRNLLPGIFLARFFGVDAKDVRKELATVGRLPHRLEVVRVHHDITYINDSAATMPDATIAALDSFPDVEVVLICGGSDKALLFEELAKRAAKARLRAIVFLPGTATARLQQAIDAQVSITVPRYTVDTMAEAVRLAGSTAQPGDTVLLSPGATSFGLFQHEFDRGNQFRDLVLALV